MDCSMPGLPVHHQLLEFTQTHVHWVGDAIQSSHPIVPFSRGLSRPRGRNQVSCIAGRYFTDWAHQGGLISIRMARIKKTRINKYWWGCKEKGTLVHCWWKCRWVQPPWKTAWRHGGSLKSQQSHFWVYIKRKWNSYFEEVAVHLSSAELFTIAKLWK